MMHRHIVILGSSFAGYTAALELRKKMDAHFKITVISKTADFVFMPSLIWLPFGLRFAKDITFQLQPIYEKHGIRFLNEEALEIDLGLREVRTLARKVPYDYLILATGAKLNYQAVPGLGPHEGYTQSIFSLPDACLTAKAWNEFLNDPGDVVIGAAPGASCFVAVYEFLLNFVHQVQKKELSQKIRISFVTPEPFLGHMGIGGFKGTRALIEKTFAASNIRVHTGASIAKITPGQLHLTYGPSLPFRFAMIAPSFLGVDAVRNLKPIVTETGFVKVTDIYNTMVYPEIFAAGMCVHIPPPGPTAIPCGVPKTGFMSEEMAHLVAHNIYAMVEMQHLKRLPPAEIATRCVLDAGKTGVILWGDHILQPRKNEWVIPGPEAHWAKLAFEKIFFNDQKTCRCLIGPDKKCQRLSSATDSCHSLAGRSLLRCFGHTEEE